MIRDRIAAAVLSYVLVVGLSGCEQAVPAASSQTTPEDLAVRVKAVEDLIPSQSHMMADVGDHFTNLWFAGRAENWLLTDFYVCYACHKAVDKPYLRPQVPTEPASRIINFDPKANWPL